MRRLTLFQSIGFVLIGFLLTLLYYGDRYVYTDIPIDDTVVEIEESPDALPSKEIIHEATNKTAIGIDRR